VWTIKIQLAAWNGCKGSREVGTAMHSIPVWTLGIWRKTPKSSGSQP